MVYNVEMALKCRWNLKKGCLLQHRQSMVVTTIKMKQNTIINRYTPFHISELEKEEEEEAFFILF